MNKFGRILLSAGAVGAATLTYSAAIERRHWTLRQATVPVLAEGTPPIRVLHISDLHMTPNQRSKQRWVSELADLDPDFVVNTGDNLAHPQAVPAALRAMGSLLDKPGVFIFGSNDYYGPKPKNPARYLLPSAKTKRIHGEPLPWRDLRAAMTEHGWLDATHRHHDIDVKGTKIHVAGLDDPHLHLDRYEEIAGQPPADAGLKLGVTHSPEPRVLDCFAEDGYDLVMAGHTHGGQLRVPGYGALTTNCDLDRSRARGASTWGERMHLHVSAGLGTSPYAPVRFACPPEATLLTLLPRAEIPAATSKNAESRTPYGAGEGIR